MRRPNPLDGPFADPKPVKLTKGELAAAVAALHTSLRLFPHDALRPERERLAEWLGAQAHTWRLSFTQEGLADLCDCLGYYAASHPPGSNEQIDAAYAMVKLVQAADPRLRVARAVAVADKLLTERWRGKS